MPHRFGGWMDPDASQAVGGLTAHALPLLVADSQMPSLVRVQKQMPCPIMGRNMLPSMYGVSCPMPLYAIYGGL